MKESLVFHISERAKRDALYAEHLSCVFSSAKYKTPFPSAQTLDAYAEELSSRVQSLAKQSHEAGDIPRSDVGELALSLFLNHQEISEDTETWLSESPTGFLFLAEKLFLVSILFQNLDILKKRCRLSLDEMIVQTFHVWEQLQQRLFYFGAVWDEKSKRIEGSRKGGKKRRRSEGLELATKHVLSKKPDLTHEQIWRYFKAHHHAKDFRSGKSKPLCIGEYEISFMPEETGYEPDDTILIEADSKKTYIKKKTFSDYVTKIRPTPKKTSE
jgi:hypothetical protein